MATISAALVKELRERTGLGMVECKRALAGVGGDVEKAIEELRKSGQAKAAKKAGRTAAEGVVISRVVEGGKAALVLEVNSETDFVAHDAGFLAFAESVIQRADTENLLDINALKAAVEADRQALIQKIGENVNIRRVSRVEGDTVASYVHGNRIAVLVVLTGGHRELAHDVAMHVAASNPEVVRPADMPAEVIDKEKDIIKAQPDMAGKPENVIEKMIAGRIKKFVSLNSLTEQPFVKNPDVTVGQMVKDGGAEIVSFVRFEVGEGIDKEEVDFAAEVAAAAAASN